MGFFTRLLGYEGTVRFEGETVDGQAFSGKTKVECIGLDRAELEQELKKILFVEIGKRAKTLRVVGAT